MLSIELAHAIRIEKDQCDEYIDGSLLREPEAELVTPERNVIQRLDENDSEQEGNDKPDGEAQTYEAQVG
jgi:hypothetical protein